MLKLALVAILSLSAVSGQEIVISSPPVTDWGDWGPMELCSPGNFVYGMHLRTERDQGTFGDDSALNGVQLLCISPTVKRNAPEFLAKDPVERAFETITSNMGHEGDFGSVYECPEPEFVVGFQLKSEDDQGAFDDDTGANNLRIICSGGGILEGDGERWGGYTEEQRCPRGLYVCGIQTQVEAVSDTDDTTLNNIRMGCCTHP